jgi:hypothetical protein
MFSMFPEECRGISVIRQRICSNGTLSLWNIGSRPNVLWMTDQSLLNLAVTCALAEQGLRFVLSTDQAV